MGLINYAKTEFLKLGYTPIEECEDDSNKWIQENVLELLEVLAKQGHSGFSIGFAIEYFSKLAKFEPLSPILCTNDEWIDISDISDKPSFQNNRCSVVFKNGINDKPYFLDAIIWVNESGETTSGYAFNSKHEKINSCQTIKIPFIPKTFYIDVFEVEIEKDNFEYRIKNESQLKEVWKYYEHQETLSYLRSQKLNELYKKNN